MKTVGTYEAKTKFTALLKSVAGGESVTIARHGVPVAVLRAADAVKAVPAKEVIAELKAFRAAHSLGGLSVRDLIEEGRR